MERLTHAEEQAMQAVWCVEEGNVKSFLELWKGQEAIERYGEKGKNGVVEIKKKKPAMAPVFNPFAPFEKKDC